jgi:hypothetical protein
MRLKYCTLTPSTITGLLDETFNSVLPLAVVVITSTVDFLDNTSHSLAIDIVGPP